MISRNTKIRIATIDDLSVIEDLRKNDMRKISEEGSRGSLLERDHDLLEEMVTSGNQGRFYVATDENNRVVGAAGVFTYARVAEIGSVVVTPEYRSNGVGAKLIEACIGYASGQGVSQVFTLTDKPAVFSQYMQSGAKPVEKVVQDCYRCPLITNCPETSMSLRATYLK